jgi:hypothetical protein
MSAEDPRAELDELFEAIETDKIPGSAVPFFDKYDEIARSILDTIESMIGSGASAPTSAQRRALRNIYLGCCRWLGKTPEPSKIGPDPDFGATPNERLVREI